MSRLGIPAFLASILMVHVGTLAQQDDGPTHFPIDPVALIGGEEHAGADDHTIVRGGYRYTFVNADNKATFAKDPEHYEVQLGGARARMGPLSGNGRSDLFAVHDGRIYIFASDGCKQTFLANPESLLEGDDPLPECTDESVKRGRELLELAVRFMGGSEPLDAIKSYQEKVVRKDGNTTEIDQRTIVIPSSFHRKQHWGESWFSMTAAPTGAWFNSRNGPRMMAASQRRALERDFKRLPLVILRLRETPKFICSWIGPGEIEGTPVEQVACAIDGATTILMIDPKTGQLHGTSHRGRGTSAAMGTIEVSFSDFETLEGVKLPRSSHVHFNGEDAEGMSGKCDEMLVNGPVAQTTFEVPKGN